jgi:hypothetical protein
MAFTLKLTGDIWFDGDGLEQVKTLRAILKKEQNVEKLEIDFLYKDSESYSHLKYTAYLGSKDGHIFKGRYDCEGEKYDAPISCELYKFENKIFICGKWLEGGHDCLWYCKFKISSKEEY